MYGDHVMAFAFNETGIVGFSVSFSVRFNEDIIIGSFEDEDGHHLTLHVVDGEHTDAHCFSTPDRIGIFGCEVERRRSYVLSKSKGC